jgi:uncharacterized NAD(P)/FAD-binding protein YdhS
VRVAIVGSGFSGVAIAWQLLGRLPAGSHIELINASGRFARGLAYGTHSADHLLNVPAARMSLDPAQPQHFVDWLRRRDPARTALDGHEFVSRQWYGDYLQSSLEDRVCCCPGVALVQRVGRVQNLAPGLGGWDLTLANEVDHPTHFDTVILALGHLPPRPPHPALKPDLPGYVADPWSDGVWQGLAPEAPVALIGSGLTMLDVLISLRTQGHHGPVLALSRRGLLPQRHRSNELPPTPWALAPAMLNGSSLRQRVRAFRGELARAQAKGADWRDVLSAFRPHTAAAWQALSAVERSRFLRHLLPFWDVHRHRAAPQARGVLDAAVASGQLRHAAGRVQSVQARPAESGIRLTWHARGSSQTEIFDAQRVVNCSGPSSRIDAHASPLLWGLAQAGRLQRCPDELGLLVDDSYRMLDSQGHGQPGLYYLGPHLRAQRWEATAVPELREHAAALAKHIVSGSA